MSAAHCKRCEDLEEQVAYLKSELGLTLQTEELDALRAGFKITPNEAILVSALFRAHGRTLSKWVLLDQLPTANAERDAKILDVYICKIRRQLGGAETILNSWGKGYRLSVEGRRKVAAVLEDQQAKRAAERAAA